MTSVTLTDAERLILANQYSILAKLDRDQASFYNKAEEIVTSGYEYLYSELNPSLSEPMSHAEGQEVVDILDMFRSIEFSTRKLGKKPADYGIEFRGFDGNNDHPQFFFAKLLRKDGWDELKSYPDNSHSQSSFHKYRRMLQIWKTLPNRYELSDADLTSLNK